VKFKKRFAKWYQNKVLNLKKIILIRLFSKNIFSGSNLIYWRNPIQSGIVFGVSLSVIITFMFLSSLAAISFWSLALLVVVGLYKLYNYVMATFVGRAQDDIFE
jgi:hypothetical protein